MIHIKDYIESVTVLEFKANRNPYKKAIDSKSSKEDIISFLESLGFIRTDHELLPDGNAAALPASKETETGIYKVGKYTSSNWSTHNIKVLKRCNGKNIVYLLRDADTLPHIDPNRTHPLSKIIQGQSKWEDFPTIGAIIDDMLKTYGIK